MYGFDNDFYRIYKKPNTDRSTCESKRLEDAQTDVPPDLQFFDPKRIIGLPQERQFDDLMGLFDTIGYDYERKLLNMDDIDGLIGIYLLHLRQRDVVQEYLEDTKKWAKKYKKSLPEDHYPPADAYRYLRRLIKEHKVHQDQNRPSS